MCDTPKEAAEFIVEREKRKLETVIEMHSLNINT
jgi:hypothetical protein